MSPPPDVDAARRRAFERFVAEAYEPLQRFLRRRVDVVTADDVLGDVLLVLWRRVDDIPPDAPLAWAYGVARGCLANSLRSTTRQDRLVRRLTEAPDAVTGARAGAADGSDQGPADDPALHAALDALPEGDREVLRLWAWEQLPPREIALVLGISANAASIRLHRATTKLRTELVRRKDERPPGHPGGRQGREAPR